MVRVNGQEFKTRVIDDNDNPTWNERFYPRLSRYRTGLLEGSLELMLYDEDPLKDSYVARHTIDLSALTLDQFNKPMTFSLTYVKDKYLSQGCHPVITVMLQGLLQSYNSIRTMFAPVPGFVNDDVRQSCYIPVCDAAGVVYLGVEDEKGCVDVKVYVTRPGSGLYVDVFVEGACQSTKVRRGSCAAQAGEWAGAGTVPLRCTSVRAAIACPGSHLPLAAFASCMVVGSRP